MKFNGDFIGDNTVSDIVRWTGGDSQVQYQTNVVTQSDDWYYKARPITYSFNSLGHRSKEIEDLNKENYILFLGCSHTMGVGLELEKTYPHIISQQLDCDYYNMGLPASGIDVLEYNLLMWFAKVNIAPKAVVIQWPDHSRFASYIPANAKDHLIERGSWAKDDSTEQFIISSEISGLAHARKLLTMKIVQSVVKVPLIQCIFTSQPIFSIYDLQLRQVDRARDLAHAGIKSHQAWSELLLGKLSKA
jgi:hypothetical protein